MEVKEIQLISIWGKWWEPIRKWFYPTWLIYETTLRFYDYASSVYIYIMHQGERIGEIPARFLSIFGSVGTFAICFFFLTIPGCIALFKFFKSGNPCNTSIERRLKKYF